MLADFELLCNLYIISLFSAAKSHLGFALMADFLVAHLACLPCTFEVGYSFLGQA
jgi:hypothetical protein